MSLSSRYKANDSDDDSDGSDDYFELAKKRTLQRQHGIPERNMSSTEDAASDVEDICLKEISDNLNDAGIKNICSQFGNVKGYRRMQKPPYFAFVTYATTK